jgi:hypothetical protein
LGIIKYFSGAIVGERSAKLLFLFALDLVFFQQLTYKILNPKKQIMEDDEKYAYDMLLKYCEILNLLPCTNVYERSAIESTHILQEEEDKSLSLGMPMHPK